MKKQLQVLKSLGFQQEKPCLFQGSNRKMAESAGFTFIAVIKKVFACFSLLLLMSIQANSQTYELVWADEFNGTGLPDSTKWGYELGGNIRNSELQYYTKSTNNVKQNNGNLEITVIKEDVGGKQYTSGSIITLGKADWTYGKIEGRFKMPKGQGLWACFWTLGSNFPQLSWPRCGEIDIFEHINNETMFHATAHWAGRNDRHVSSSATYTVDVTQWHDYSIVWDADYIKWFVDGVQLHQLQITGAQNYTDEFHLPQYILINLPIGGTWPGAPDATTVLPATMYCDYVRVYKNTDVTPVPVTGFSISPTIATIAVGGTLALNTTFVPANATNQNVTWTTTNPAVATVDNFGIVTAVSIGSATIRGTTVDGAKTATCAVTTQNLVGVNKLVNGNFDADRKITQLPKGWSEWSSGTGAANALNSDVNPHSPKYKGIQTGTAVYDVAVFQALTGLSNGNYTLKAWVRSSGGQSFSIMYVKNFGGSQMNYSLAVSIPVWTQIEINNIIVTNNTCEVGFYQWNAAPNTWIEYDDVEFYLSSLGAESATLKSANAPNAQLSAINDEDGSGFSVYPNPTKQGAALNIKSGTTSVFDVNIINTSGQVVYSRSGNQGGLLNIALPGLAKGIYFVKISNPRISKVQKLIVE